MPTFRDMEIILAETDTEFKDYLEEVRRRGKLVLRRCLGCHYMRYPPGAGCPSCGSLEWEWAEVSGNGTIYSYEIVVQPIQRGFRELVPYPIVLVELDEQRGVPGPGDAIRLVTNLLKDDGSPEEPDKVAIGARVELMLQPFCEDLYLPQFRLDGKTHGEPVWRMPE